MRKLLVFQHVAFEILGTLNPLLKEAGFRIRYVNFGRHPHAQPSLEGYNGLVVLGGPMSVQQVDQYPHLETEVILLREAIERGMPILGICLGAQLVAKALGADVRANEEKEIGWYDVSLTEDGRQDPVLGHFAPTERIFQWHGDILDIPPGAVHLATSPACPSQAFRYGDNIYGFQFHLEVDAPMIGRWLQVPIHRAELEALDGRIDPAEIERETPERIDQSMRLSNAVFGEFIRLFGLRPKRRMLPSR